MGQAPGEAQSCSQAFGAGRWSRRVVVSGGVGWEGQVRGPPPGLVWAKPHHAHRTEMAESSATWGPGCGSGGSGRTRLQLRAALKSFCGPKS